MTTDYKLLAAQTEALIQDVPHNISNLANVSALIYGALPDINWAGFYLLEGDTLVLGPFQGKTACTEIPYGKGVCGTAVKEGRTMLVTDVRQFEGHIACDSASRSELVIPIQSGDRIIGVLDIDSPLLDRFSREDRNGLERIVGILEQYYIEPKA